MSLSKKKVHSRHWKGLLVKSPYLLGIYITRSFLVQCKVPEGHHSSAGELEKISVLPNDAFAFFRLRLQNYSSMYMKETQVHKFIKNIIFLFYRSQTLLLDRRMFQPRKPYCDGPKKRRIDTPESKWKILQNRGGMDWPLMPLSIVTDLILWNGKNWIGEECGNGLTSLSMSWKGNMV